MSRDRWRVLRALRVVLACLVLWLPARAANASFAPADAVVMIAEAAGAGAPGEGTPSPAGNATGQRDGHRSARETTKACHAPVQLALRGDGRARTCRPKTTTNHAVDEPRYLLHCAFLL